MKKIYPIVLAILATGTALALLIRAQGTLSPFQVTMSETRYQNGVPYGSPMTRKFAVKSDGSNSRAWIDSQGNVLVKRVLDATNNLGITVDHRMSIKTTYLYSADKTSRLASAVNTTCSTNTPSIQILGYATTYLEVPYTGPSGSPIASVVVRLWRAPSLNCFPLKAEHQYTYINGAVWNTVRTATAVQLGDPETNLFTVPSAFQEVSPSQNVNLNNPGNNIEPGGMSGIDAVYWSQQSH